MVDTRGVVLRIQLNSDDADEIVAKFQNDPIAAHVMDLLCEHAAEKLRTEELKTQPTSNIAADRALVCVVESEDAREHAVGFIEPPGVILPPQCFQTVYAHVASVDAISCHYLRRLWEGLFVVREAKGYRSAYCVGLMNEKMSLNMQHFTSQPTFFKNNTDDIQRQWKVAFNKQFVHHASKLNFDSCNVLDTSVSCYDKGKSTVVVLSWTEVMHKEFGTHIASILQKLDCSVIKIAQFSMTGFAPFQNF